MFTKEQRDEILRIASRIEHASTEESEAYELANFHKYLDSITAPEGWQRVPLSDEQRLEIVENLIRPVAFNRPVAIQIGLKVSHAIEQAHGIRSEK